jgi:hypothetical protein
VTWEHALARAVRERARGRRVAQLWRLGKHAQRRSARGRCWRRALGRATCKSRCGAGSGAGEPEAERRQSRTRERLRREPMRRDADKLASGEHGS